MRNVTPNLQSSAGNDRLLCRTDAKAGFTLLEILVALLIISIALLGLAGLQTQGLRDNQSAFLRSKAVQNGEDILDRMRANRVAALGGNYDIALEAAPASPAYSGMVLTDLTEWKAVLASALPEGDGSVDVNGNVATIEVQWTEGSGVQTIIVVTRL